MCPKEHVRGMLYISHSQMGLSNVTHVFCTNLLPSLCVHGELSPGLPGDTNTQSFSSPFCEMKSLAQHQGTHSLYLTPCLGCF